MGRVPFLVSKHGSTETSSVVASTYFRHDLASIRREIMRSTAKCSSIVLSLAGFAMVCFHATPGQAQLRNLPRVSPAASVTQRIGLTDITISYHRPGVKDREIWGKLVPYNGRIPWRAGANDNTTISFTHDVTRSDRKAG